MNLKEAKKAGLGIESESLKDIEYKSKQAKKNLNMAIEEAKKIINKMLIKK